MIYLNYPYRTIDYYPDSTRIYRPLTLYYNYYYPIRSLNYYSDVWPYYPYYRYLYYKYTLPSDRYYHLKGRIIYLPSPTSDVSYRVYPTAPYVRNKIYTPLSLYCDYYEPIRSLYWNSSYWPLYRSVSSFVDELPSRQGTRLQKIFDNETSLIRAQTSALLRKIHDPVPRVQRLSWPLSTLSRHYDDVVPTRYSSNNYIHKMLVSSPLNEKVSYTTYYTEPVRKYIGLGRLACVSYAGGRAYDRRPYTYLYENPLQSDIQLMSYYINKFRQEKAYGGGDSKAPLSPARPSRKFGSKAVQEEDAKQKEEMQKLREARAARLAFINEEDKRERHSASREVDEAVRAKKEKEEAARLAEERALAEEQARQQALAKEAARKAEIARQEELAAKAAAERAAQLERQAELARQEDARKQAEIERKRKEEEEEERARLEEQKRIEEAKAEEALRAQLRLEEIARKAEEEREAELARQAEELAELARQEAELAEQAKRDPEDEERRQRQEAELAEQAKRDAEDEERRQRQEAELEEIERQEEELAESERQEQQANEEAEAAQQAELEELERAQAELDALEAEAKAMESDLGPAPSQQAEPEVDEAELARQAELEELRRQEEELAELERAQAELDALEAEAKAMESDLGPPPAGDRYDEDEDDQAIAEDVPGAQSDEGED